MSTARTLRVLIVVGAAVLLTSCIGFASPESVSVPGGSVLGDITGDGTSDFLSSTASGLARYEYCGAGCVNAKEVIPGEQLQFVGDFNNDGKQDVVAYDGSNYELLFGSATGLSSANAVTIPRVLDGYVIDRVADFNGDGKTDLLWGNLLFGFINHYVAQLGNGAGGFTASSLGTALPYGETGPTQLEVGDVNGDGRDDLITTAIGQVQVTEYGGPQCDSFGPGMPVTCAAFQQQFPSDQFAVGDINGDGKDDLARYQFSTNAIDFFRSTGTGFTPFPPYQTITPAVSGMGRQMSLRDIDHDGIVDFLLNDGATPGTWWSGTNDGGFPYQTLTDVPLRATGCTLCFGDVNGDGRLDAVVPETTTSSQLWLNTSENLDT